MLVSHLLREGVVTEGDIEEGGPSSSSPTINAYLYIMYIICNQQQCLWGCERQPKSIKYGNGKSEENVNQYELICHWIVQRFGMHSIV